MPPSFCKLKIAARDSNLSKAQFVEFCQILNKTYPRLVLEPLFIKTKGDKDKKTSLKDLYKTNFFTEELDILVQEKQCDAALHSAKDLPEPLPKDLVRAYLSLGIDSRDALVTKKIYSWEEIPYQSYIATSSERRESQVLQKRKDLLFVDLRGTIEERLEVLQKKEVEGVVVAEAALIRLKLTFLPRLFLEGETESLQGKLAVIVHKERKDLIELFSFLD